MAKKTAKKQQTTVNYQLTINPVRMALQDISKWRLAVDQARDPNFPRRRLLYELYDQVILDGHLFSVMEKRKLSLLNKKIHYNEVNKSGEVNETIKTLILDAPWFYDLLEASLDADNFGHSLCEVKMEAGNVKSVETLNRANVIPEVGLLIWNYFQMPAIAINGRAFRDNLPLAINDSIGIWYRDNPAYTPTLFEFGKAKSYGRLMIAAQYAILKRNGFGDWAQFAELFGFPFRVGKYDPFDASSRTLLEDGLDNMGGAGWAVVPKGTELEFHDHNNSGKSEVFSDLIDRCNAELSKIFLGNTMTTEDGSSRSQSETHKESEDELKVADMIKGEHTSNFIIKPKLQALFGIDMPGKFNYPQVSEIPLEKRITIDAKLAELIPITEEYFYNTYGVDKPKDGQTPVRAKLHVEPDTPSPEDKLKEEDKPKEKEPESDPEIKKTKLTARLDSLYGHAISHLPGKRMLLKAGDKKKLDKIWERLLKSIHDGKTKPGEIDPELVKFIRTQLMDGVKKGIGNYGSGKADEALIANLEADVKVFSGFKTYHELRAATDLLTDTGGKIKSFADFRADAVKLNETYNLLWLETEYNYAVASAQMASNWSDYQATKETLPTLTYRTAGDEHVREEHAELEGITRPIDDDFWNVFYPPNGWGCRCDTDQGDEEVTNIEGRDFKQPPEMFRTNTAKDGTVFPSKHPYYDVSNAEKQSIMDQLNDIN